MSNMIQSAHHVSSTMSSEPVDEAEVQKLKDKISELENKIVQLDSTISGAEKQIENAKMMIKQYESTQNPAEVSADTVPTPADIDIAQPKALLFNGGEFMLGLSRMLKHLPGTLGADKKEEKKFFIASNLAANALEQISVDTQGALPPLLTESYNKFSAINMLQDSLSSLAQEQATLKTEQNKQQAGKSSHLYKDSLDKSQSSYEEVMVELKIIDDPQVTAKVNQIMSDYTIPNRG